jgi:hypothetical protein
VFIELREKIELAVCDLLTAKKTEIENVMQSADYDSDFFAVGLGIYPEHETIEISFATREDYNKNPTEQGYWSYYAFSSSLEITTDNITAAIATSSDVALMNHDNMEELPTEVYVARSNLILFAAAQALKSKRVWHCYNQIQLPLLEGKVDEYRKEKKNMNQLAVAIDHYKSDNPSLQCVVVDRDEPWRTNFCYMTEILTSVGDYTGEIMEAIG